MISFIEYNNIGEITDEVAISVDSAGAVSYTVVAGKKGVSFQNVGNKIAWYGGETVAPASNRGNKMFPQQSIIYKNVKNTFKVYFKCGAGDTTIIGVVSHN